MLLGSPIDAGVAIDRAIEAVWRLLKGGAAIKTPEPQDLSRRYAELLTDSATGQRQRDAWREVEPDQQADIRKANAEFAAEQRRHRGDALELERHRQPHGEQNGQNAPAIAQCSFPNCGASLRR